MLTSELLEELRGGILRDASTLKSGPPDHYWSDTRLLNYLNVSYRRFARRTLCLRDDVTAEVVQVTLDDSVELYTLHPSIIQVVSARHQDSTTDMIRISHPVRYSYQNPFTDSFDYSAQEIGSRPAQFATDEGISNDPDVPNAPLILFKPTPSAAEKDKIVYLRVIRLPLTPLQIVEADAEADPPIDAIDTVPEIPEDYHLDLCEWAAWLALRNWDLDAEDRRKAEQHKARFAEAVLECKHEVMMKTFQPVLWTFGQNGFAYTR